MQTLSVKQMNLFELLRPKNNRNTDVYKRTPKNMADEDFHRTYENTIFGRTTDATKIFFRLITESNITESSTIVALIDTSMNIMQEVVTRGLFEELEEFDPSSLDLGITIIDSLTYFGGLFSDHEMEPEARYCFQKAINGLRDEDWWNGEMKRWSLTPEGEWQKMYDLLLQNIEALDNPHGGAIQIFGEALDYVILFTFISPSRTADPRNEDLDDISRE